MPYFAKKVSESENDVPEQGEHKETTKPEDKKNPEELVSDEDIEDLIKPELFTLNVPAIMEILFGLFISFYAIMLILLSLNIGLDSDLGARTLAQGIGFVVLGLISFFVGYGIIMKNKYGTLIGFGKGLFLIVYFAYSAFDYRRLMLEAESGESSMLADLYLVDIYWGNMIANVFLLISVLFLTLLIVRIILVEGHFKTLFSKPVVDADDK
jgi:hypothetical protein